MVRIFVMIITERAKTALHALQQRYPGASVKLFITSLRQQHWLILQVVDNTADKIYHFAAFLCPADPATATFDHNDTQFRLHD